MNNKNPMQQIIGVMFLGIAIGALIIIFVNNKGVFPSFSFANDPENPSQINPNPVKSSNSTIQASQHAEPEKDLTYEELELALPDMIDNLAGHPDDPQLPKNILGAADEVLLGVI